MTISDDQHSSADLLGLGAKDLAQLKRLIPRLHKWYGCVARDLPWRQTKDPYAIWVSEVMLQQTQVATVLPYFQRWMSAFPTCAELADAEEGAVLRLWEGLGYYARARSLRRAALEVQQRFDGRIPEDIEDFSSLPGVGSYTTAAVLSIAFDVPLAAVDGNVRRIITRLTATRLDPRRPPASHHIQELAQLLLTGSPGLHNQAVMELGALVCHPRIPDCQTCPLNTVCRAYDLGCPEEFPTPGTRRKIPHVDVAIGVVRKGDQFFIDKRPADGMLGGLWEFPGGKLELGETPEKALVRELWEEFGMEVQIDQPIPKVNHAYTHLKVTLHPFLCTFVQMNSDVGEGRPWRWVGFEGLSEVAMPRANRKVLEGLSKIST